MSERTSETAALRERWPVYVILIALWGGTLVFAYHTGWGRGYIAAMEFVRANR